MPLPGLADTSTCLLLAGCTARHARIRAVGNYPAEADAARRAEAETLAAMHVWTAVWRTLPSRVAGSEAVASRLTQRPNSVAATDRSRMGSLRGVRNTRWAGAVARSTPPVQAGSGIVPGKVDPELAEAARQVAFDTDRTALHFVLEPAPRGGSRQALLREGR